MQTLRRMCSCVHHTLLRWWVILVFYFNHNWEIYRKYLHVSRKKYSQEAIDNGMLFARLDWRIYVSYTSAYTHVNYKSANYTVGGQQYLHTLQLVYCWSSFLQCKKLSEKMGRANAQDDMNRLWNYSDLYASKCIKQFNFFSPLLNLHWYNWINEKKNI